MLHPERLDCTRLIVFNAARCTVDDVIHISAAQEKQAAGQKVEQEGERETCRLTVQLVALPHQECVKQRHESEAVAASTQAQRQMASVSTIHTQAAQRSA
mmetsp:Transcript_16244/g.49465  ORF Transcript_16244/g.49465 Transcript_16244/m.49465 type:complete len:100 (+) Transcript_16244:195-494(+)